MPAAPPDRDHKPEALRSVRSLFLLAMAVLVLLLSAPPLLAGGYLLDSLISRFGAEILTEKLEILLHPVDLRYERLQRVGLEDSEEHRQEIFQEALADFADFRYRKSGSVFVIRRDGAILLSSVFASSAAPGFPDFLQALRTHQQGLLRYKSTQGVRLAAIRYYPPWESHVGIGIDRNELFAPKTLLFSIHLLILALAIGIAALFTAVFQRYLISPLILLTDFATRVRQGDHAAPLPGTFILELGRLRDDLLAMVASLRREMQETGRQLQVIRKREAELDQAVSRLQESEERYREIFNAPSEAIFIHDAASGRILDINRATSEMYGYSAEEARSLPVAAFSAGEAPYGQAEAQEKIVAAMTVGPQLFPWLARRKNGEAFWVEVALRLTEFRNHRYIIAVVRDIEARKRAEAALLTETERLAVTLRSIADGVITTDPAGRVTLLNPVAEKLSGWRQEEAIAQPLALVFQAVDPRSGTAFSCPPAPPGQTAEMQLELRARGGEQRQITAQTAPLLDPEGKNQGMVIVFRDISARLRTEQELLKIKKLEAVGVLAAGIAHDFNNLLAAILGNLELAATLLPTDHQAGKLLREANRGCLRARDLTLQLLTFAKGGAPIRSLGSIAALLRDSASFTLRGSPIICHFEIPDDLWLVNADQGQLSQVIQNLVLNARQAMEDGGELFIACQNREQAPAAPGREGDRVVAISIRDTGPGIPPEQLAYIFEPYFSTKKEGSGLGLSICHSIIAKHEGSIEVASTPGTGTIFTILLPASGPGEEPAAAVAPAPEEKGGGARILVMDDEEMVRDIAGSMLAHLGHQATMVTEGDQAIAAYQEALAAGRPFDLVIMDLTIPGGMGGKEAVGRILALDPAARVVVSSGYSEDPVMADYRRYGFSGVMAKPFLLDDLIRLLRQQLSPGPASGQKNI